MKALYAHSKMKNDLQLTSIPIENLKFIFIRHMYRENIFLTDDVILEKANRLQASLKNRFPTPKRTSHKFSRGWLRLLKSGNNFGQNRSHGESADFDHPTVEVNLPLLLTLLSAFPLYDLFHCDEFSLSYRQACTTTIGPSRLPWHKRARIASHSFPVFLQIDRSMSLRLLLDAKQATVFQ